MIGYAGGLRRDDYLFRVSLKAVVLDRDGQVLVVREAGRDWWDIPGGGVDHGETIREALARELHEEVSLEGDFDYEVIYVEDPKYLQAHNLYQIRITFAIMPQQYTCKPGVDGDEVMFADPRDFKDSELPIERQIYEYSQIALARRSAA